MHIAISNFSPETTIDEIRQALEDFGVSIRDITLENDEDGDHTLALVDVDTDELGAKALAERINGHVWKGRRLRARAYLFINK